MPKLPVISGKKIVKAFSKIGFELDHQTGSHMILRQKESPFRRLTIPNHKVVSTGTLKEIINQSGLSREEFIKLLK